ncbi:MAG: exodeoxyribonuclease VII small subunit [Bacteroidaceae bacterium]|nr:exodeoxyribonuclease VII small subunit [Bacteroidaceae bacterium]
MKKENFKYAEGVKRLEEIVRQIESDDLDVDVLMDRLKEAKALLKSCKEKLYKVEQGINEILQEDAE